MKKRPDIILQYLRSEFPGFDVSDVTNRGDVDYSYCVQRPGEILSLKARRGFIDGKSAPEVASEFVGSMFRRRCGDSARRW